MPKPGVGLDWTNKLPVDGSIEVVTWSEPKIGSVTVAGTNLIFSVSDGFPGSACDVVIVTEVTTPPPDWTVLNSGNFEWLGQITIANDLNFTEPQRYFSVRAP